MSLDINRLETFGDVRRDILETLQMLKRGDIPTSLGMAIFAGHKVLNENVQVEINCAKLALATKNEAHGFVPLIEMGKNLISGT